MRAARSARLAFARWARDAAASRWLEARVSLAWGVDARRLLRRWHRLAKANAACNAAAASAVAAFSATQRYHMRGLRRSWDGWRDGAAERRDADAADAQADRITRMRSSIETAPASDSVVAPAAPAAVPAATPLPASAAAPAAAAAAVPASAPIAPLRGSAPLVPASRRVTSCSPARVRGGNRAASAAVAASAPGSPSMKDVGCGAAAPAAATSAPATPRKRDVACGDSQVETAGSEALSEQSAATHPVGDIGKPVSHPASHRASQQTDHAAAVAGVAPTAAESALAEEMMRLRREIQQIQSSGARSGFLQRVQVRRRE